MQIYITNLKTSKNRRQHMERQLKDTKLSYEFFECVVGADLSENEIAAKCNLAAIKRQNQYKKVEWFNKGVIGCTMTNQNIYRDIIRRNLDYALFLEDDIRIPENLNEILLHAEKHIKQGDVIMLFWKGWEPLKLSKPANTTPFQFNYYLPANVQRIFGGSAYIVTKKAAQQMLDTNTPIRVAPDSWGFFCENKCIDRLLIAYPLVIETVDFRSTMRTGNFLLIRDLIDKYKIFPFYQLLKMKRKKLKKATLMVEFIQEN